MVRSFPYPEPGHSSVMFVTDTHFGRRDWTASQLAAAGRDIDFLEKFVDGVLVGGDQIHWGINAAPEDDQWNAWYSARAKTKPWVVAAGNHDLNCFTAPYDNRTAARWRQVTDGQPQNQSIQIGPTRMISLSPDNWIRTASGEGPMSLSTATLDWLDQQLAADSRPAWLAAHVPLPQQYGGHMDAATSNRLAQIIGARRNVLGWLSGHRHANILTDVNHAKTVTTGGRMIAGINGPPAGGQVQRSVMDPWDSPLHAMVLTYRPGFVRCRWRNLLTQTWASFRGSRILDLPISI